jgi:D-alanine-D-alanine ligase
MKRNIAVVAGGYSSEVVVSLRSAQGIVSFLDKEKYNVFVVVLKKDEWYVLKDEERVSDVDKDDFSFTPENGKKVKFDFAYITIHGTPGEDGRLQGYFEMLGIPYSSCGVLTSALTFNKYTCNKFLSTYGVKVAKSIRLFEGQTVETDKAVAELGLPLFVKPNDGGSSFGVSKVKEPNQLQPAIKKAFDEGKEVVLDSFIKGTEVTCGGYRTKDKTVIFPVTEVVTENEFFDFDAKYNGQVQEITPARISDELTKKIQTLTTSIYGFLDTKGLVRIDYIIPEDGEPFLLEINTTPGMTPTSFIPQQVRAAGLDIKDVLTDIIENEFK